MDDLLNSYFQLNYTEEQKSLLFRALGLCNVFGYTDPFTEIELLLTQEQEIHAENIRDGVFDIIESAMDYIVSQNRIALENDPSLSFKVAFLEAIFAIPYRDYYTSYVGIVTDIERSKEQKLAAILADLSTLSQEEIMEHLDSVYEKAFERLSQLILEKAKEEEEQEDIELLKEIRKGLIVFEQAFGIPSALDVLATLDFAKGCPFDTYLSIFKEEVIDPDMETTAWRLLYLALCSSDGHNNPQLLLKDRSEQLFENLRLATAFNNMIQKAMGRYQEFRSNLK